MKSHVANDSGQHLHLLRRRWPHELGHVHQAPASTSGLHWETVLRQGLVQACLTTATLFAIATLKHIRLRCPWISACQATMTQRGNPTLLHVQAR